MTTDPTAARPTSATTPQPAVPASAAPYGIAPIAAPGTTPPRRSRRRKVVDAAVVTSALATLPIAAAWTRSDTTEQGPTLVEAVSELDAAEDETAFRASTAALKATAQRRATTATVTPAVAGPPAVTPVATTPDALGRQGDGAPAAAPARPAAAPTVTTEEDVAETLEAAADAATASEPTPIARVAGIELVAPSKDTVLVGFHEAAAPGTLEMESLAPLAVALNGEGTDVAAGASDDQVAPVMELPTRERGQAAASAVDIAVPAWRDIVAPVSGTVTAVNPYTLYGEFADNRVEIEPEGQPGVRVIMIHIGEIEVQPGDEVVAGETLIAKTAKQFPFSSQIDRFAEHVSGKARPHVHMEVMRVG